MGVYIDLEGVEMADLWRAYAFLNTPAKLFLIEFCTRWLYS